MKKSPKKNQKRTFNEILADVRPSTRQRLWEQAIAANQIAKISKGSSRRLAYTTKHKKLQALVDQSEAVMQTDDTYEYPLLSITLNHFQRLHARFGEIQRNHVIGRIDPLNSELKGA